MSVRARPTCVTVIGWFWIIVGGLLCWSGFKGFTSIQWTVWFQSETGYELPLISKIFPFVVIAHMPLGVFGIVSGVNFLKLRHWARIALLVMSAVAFVYITSFGVYSVIVWVQQTSAQSLPSSFVIAGVAMGVFTILLFGSPFAVVIRFLMGEVVWSAMR